MKAPKLLSYLPLFAATALLAGCPTTTAGGPFPGPDAGAVSDDDPADDLDRPSRGDDDDDRDDIGGGIATVEIVSDRDVLDVDEEIVVRAQALSDDGLPTAFPAGVSLTWSSMPPGLIEVEESSPPNAIVTGIASGSAVITVTVAGVTAQEAIEIAPVVDTPPTDDIRYSYNGEDCEDYAVDGKDVWACAIMESGSFAGDPMLQVCREGEWINVGLYSQSECDACGYGGQETAPGAISQTDECANPLL